MNGGDDRKRHKMGRKRRGTVINMGCDFYCWYTYLLILLMFIFIELHRAFKAVYIMYFDLEGWPGIRNPRVLYLSDTYSTSETHPRSCIWFLKYLWWLTMQCCYLPLSSEETISKIFNPNRWKDGLYINGLRMDLACKFRFYLNAVS